MPQTIRLLGVAAEGRHGVTEEERERPQRLLIDLELLVDVGADDLSATVDYDEAARVVRGLVAAESFRLIETLAERVAGVLAALDGVRSCRAVVHKPRAADALGARDVSAEATVRSDE